MKVIVIGGVAAGMSAASKLKRRLGNNVDIVVYEKGGDVSYGACGIPFYISGHIAEAQALVARTAEEFSKSGIPVRTHCEVTSVDTYRKCVTVKNQQTGESFSDSYDKLVIGSGASTRHFPPFQTEYKNLFEVRDLTDGTRIRGVLMDETKKKVIIVGAGFIGLEVAESCKKYGKDVTVIELAERILSTYEPEASAVLQAELEKNVVTVMTASSVIALETAAGIIRAVTVKTGETVQSLSADIVINCAGIAPATGFITGIEKAGNGAILVNENMETSIPDIYAAGDCSIMRSAITGEYAYTPLGTNANKQGRIIGDVLGGAAPSPFKLIGSSALRLFGVDAAKVGLSAADAKACGLSYKTNLITGNSYASYYSSEKLSIKLVYDAETRKILGASVWGQEIVVPRANYYAIAIYAGLTVDEMGFMDLCYSPPFSGVWDAALIASNTAK